ncbi:MAG: PASTA domain-containing protein [Elusimicrobiota bacterium]
MGNLIKKLGLFALELIIVLAVSYGSFEWMMHSIVHARKEVTVPSLVGKNLRQALDILSREGLALAKESDEFNPNVPAGSIVKQYPLPNTKVREGKIVRAALSVGNEKISVPELTGLPLRKAEIEIRAVQMALGETNEIYSLKQPKGYVIDQDPKPLALTDKGGLVNVMISLGEPPGDKLIVPDFKNNDQDAASAWAKENAIPVKVLESWDPAAKRDRSVAAQNLKPDTILDREDIEARRVTLEITVARSMSEPSQGQHFDYVVPAKPLRTREVMIKSLVNDGEERGLYHGRAGPGEKIRAPLGSLANQSRLRIRIYLDGVFMEERSLP